MRLFHTKKPIPQEDINKKTAQDWLPFQDVAGSVIYRCDNDYVVALKVEPINISLKSENEKKRIISAVHEAMNGQTKPLQVLSLPRPVDLDVYLENLQQQARETLNTTKKRLLQEYIQYVAAVVHSGEAIERRYYILLAQKGGQIKELLQRAYELASSLERSGLKITTCNDMQVLDMLFSFLQPSQSAFENTPDGLSLVSLYSG